MKIALKISLGAISQKEKKTEKSHEKELFKFIEKGTTYEISKHSSTD